MQEEYVKGRIDEGEINVIYRFDCVILVLPECQRSQCSVDSL